MMTEGQPPLDTNRAMGGRAVRSAVGAMVRPVAMVLAVLMLVSGISVGSFVDQAGAATSEQATLLSPVQGSITSSPSSHLISFRGDFSMDIGAGAGSPVVAKFANPSGALRLEVLGSPRETCGGGRQGGKQVTVGVWVDGVRLGTIVYGHLSNARGPGVIANGTSIGTVASGLPVDARCWTGPHVHLEPRNDSAYACYTQNTGGLSPNSPIAVMGGSYASTTRRACPPGATDGPPRPAWSASYVDQHAFLDSGQTRPWDLGRAYPGQEGWLRFRVRNTGSKTWSRGGSNPVLLGTASPRNRSSALFVSGAWLSAGRPTAMSEASVAPGRVATFLFRVRVPAGSGTFREHFQVVAEHAAWMGPVMWRDIARNSPPSAVWGVNASDRVYSRQGSGWQRLPGRLTHLDAGSRGELWGVNAAGSVYRHVGNGRWTRMPGRLSQVSVGSRSDGSPLVMGVNNAGRVYRFDSGRWTRLSGRLAQVEVGDRGEIWGVNPAGSVYQYAGSNRWTRVSGVLKQVSVGSNTDGSTLVWGVNRAGSVYRYQGSRWTRVSGRLDQIDVGTGEVWGVNSSDRVFRYSGNGAWTNIAGRLDHVSAGT